MQFLNGLTVVALSVITALCSAPLLVAQSVVPEQGARAPDSVRVPDSSSDSVLTVAIVREAAPIVVPGSDEENYLRYLQSVGKVAAYPWTVRSFGRVETRRLSVLRGSHPWSAGMRSQSGGARFQMAILPASLTLRLNSHFPYGSNDGAVWAGRGLTTAVEGGAVFLAGPLSIAVNPIAFRAENASFGLLSNGYSGPQSFADGRVATEVDRPQRFGDNAYSRLDPGQSSVRVDLSALTLGVSTANMGWGPMESFPFVVGGNAPGFLHAFVGTGTPVNVLIGRLHTRLIWGRLEQSAYSPVVGSKRYFSATEPGTQRFASGLVASFQPRGLPGLEIGGSRFFHSFWPQQGLPRSYFFKPLGAILRSSSSPSTSPGLGDAVNGSSDNQLASVFTRLVLPSDGFEIYAEYGKEDYAFDFRDFIQEPDHARSYGLGARKVFVSRDSSLTGIRGELINYQLPTLARHRGEGRIYSHGVLRQGHTNRGQVLGADAGIGTGAASTLAYDRFTHSGLTSVSWTRIVRQENGTFFEDGRRDQRSQDVSHALRFQKSRRIAGLEASASLAAVREFNRDFLADQWNLNSILSVRHHFGRR
ncbi:MAG: hypothetical protein H0T21_07105 [Gemmatimonadaceae bacterium]|nr:hypothetical protein [Gemmatimonadaceae bacterium]